MFIFRAKEIIKEIDKFSPEILEFCRKSLNQSEYDLDFRRLNKETFSKCPNLSIDVAVMEKTNKGLVIPLDAGWSDIGSWQAVWETSNKDQSENVVKGKVILNDSKKCLIRSEHRLVVGVGLTNLVVIETNDAILVSKRDSTQKVKKVVQELNNSHFEERYFRLVLFLAF